MSNPPHDDAAHSEQDRLDNFNGGILTGAEAICLAQHDVHFQATRRSYFHLRERPRDERDEDEIQKVAYPGHAKLYTAFRLIP